MLTSLTIPRRMISFLYLHTIGVVHIWFLPLALYTLLPILIRADKNT
jgi:hypothetical protein